MPPPQKRQAKFPKITKPLNLGGETIKQTSGSWRRCFEQAGDAHYNLQLLMRIEETNIFEILPHTPANSRCKLNKQSDYSALVIMVAV